MKDNIQFYLHLKLRTNYTMVTIRPYSFELYQLGQLLLSMVAEI